MWKWQSVAPAGARVFGASVPVENFTVCWAAAVRVSTPKTTPAAMPPARRSISRLLTESFIVFSPCEDRRRQGEMMRQLAELGGSLDQVCPEVGREAAMHGDFEDRRTPEIMTSPQHGADVTRRGDRSVA